MRGPLTGTDARTRYAPTWDGACTRGVCSIVCKKKLEEASNDAVGAARKAQNCCWEDKAAGFKAGDFAKEKFGGKGGEGGARAL